MNKLLGYMFAVLTCLHGYMSGWAATGMETVFYAALVTMFVYAVVKKASPLVMAILIVSVILTRHDGLLLLPVYLWYQYKNTRHVIYVIVMVTIYYLARFVYYDDVIPHVMQIKSVTPYYHANPSEMLSYWITYASAVLFAFMVSFNKKYVPLYVYCVVSMAIYAFGVRADLVRYSVHILPVMSLLILFSGKRFSCEFMLALVLMMSFGVRSSLIKYRSFVFDYRTTQDARRMIGETVKNNIPVSEDIISGDLGMIGYTAINHKFIDMVGLVSKPNPGQARYIADTMSITNTGGLKGRIPGVHKPLKVYGIQNKPYVIGLFEQQKVSEKHEANGREPIHWLDDDGFVRNNQDTTTINLNR